MDKTGAAVGGVQIERSIVTIRGQRVLIDSDLANLYGIATKVLVQATNRNLDRFPADFMFRLTADEWRALRSQIVTSKEPRGGRRYAPYAFTEQGVAMLSSVLNSAQAIAVNIEIVRAFVRFRELLISNSELARRIQEVEEKAERLVHEHGDFAEAIRQQMQQVFAAIRALLTPANEPHGRPIGFVELEDKSKKRKP